jgi:hypothetical protein
VVAAVGSSDNIACLQPVCRFHENDLEENLELSIVYPSALEALIGFQTLEADPTLFN